MRFGDFFYSYKVGLKEIAKPWWVALRNAQWYEILMLIGAVLGLGYAIIFREQIDACANSLRVMWPFLIEAAIFVIYFYCSSRKKNMAKALNEGYKPYAKKRMKMLIELLQQYHIDYKDDKSIDALIAEAKVAQTGDREVALFKKFVQVILFPAIAYVAKVVVDNYATKIIDLVAKSDLRKEAIASVILILMITVCVGLFLTPILRSLLYWDYGKYEALIYDLRQIKLFTANKKLLEDTTDEEPDDGNKEVSESSTNDDAEGDKEPGI